MALFAAHATDQLKRRRKGNNEEIVTTENTFNQYLNNDISEPSTPLSPKLSTSLMSPSSSTSYLRSPSSPDSISRTSSFLTSPSSPDSQVSSITSPISPLRFFSMSSKTLEEEEEEEEQSHISVNVNFFGLSIDLNGLTVSVLTWMLKYACVILIGKQSISLLF